MPQLDGHPAAPVRSARLEELAAAYRRSIYCRTDRWFLHLLIFQWAAAIGVAWWISPLTWEGTANHTHPHVWTAIFLGGRSSLCRLC